jgi:LCP family protein required for cell wall assembly
VPAGPGLLALPPLVLLRWPSARSSARSLERLAILLDPNVIVAILVLEGVLVLWRLVAVADAFRRGNGHGAGARRGPQRGGARLRPGPERLRGVPDQRRPRGRHQGLRPADKPYEPQPVQPGSTDPTFGTSPGLDRAVPSATAPSLGRFTMLLWVSTPARARRSPDRHDDRGLARPRRRRRSMVSVPRDMVDVPLPDGRTFRPKINSLVTYWKYHQNKFPGATSGEAVLSAALGKLLNVRIDAWAEVNLPGFVNVIDSIGGVDVTVRNALCDARYDEYGFNGFAIDVGPHHLDGQTALAYARIRKSYGENDFTRAARQGEIVVAARDRIMRGGFLNDPAGSSRHGQAGADQPRRRVDLEVHSLRLDLARPHLPRRDHLPARPRASNDPRGSVLIPRMSRSATLPNGRSRPRARSRRGSRRFPRTTTAR